MMDVHMHRPNTNSKHFVDALGAFWPGLQVLSSDWLTQLNTDLWLVDSLHYWSLIGSGVDGGSEASNWTTRGLVPDHAETQLPTWGSHCRLSGILDMSNIFVRNKYLSGSLGPAPPETGVCGVNIFPVQSYSGSLLPGGWQEGSAGNPTFWLVVQT